MNSTRRKLRVLTVLAVAVVVVLGVGETAIRLAPGDGWGRVLGAFALGVLAVVALAVIGLVAAILRREQ